VARGGASYAYDSAYQLTGASVPGLPEEAYAYDPAGNRISGPAGGTWTYNANNELTGRGAIAYAHDANGNVTHEVDGTSITLYHYDSANRLSKVELPDGSIAEYAYDPFNRRVMKTVSPSPLAGEGAGEGEATYYLYSDEGLTGEYGTSGALKKAYGWAPDGIWGTNPLYMLEDGQYFFYHNDHLGTPRKMTDESGEVVWSATYAAFGEANVDPSSTVTNNLRFPGQYFDAETGLNYNWNRYYDPETGRYTQVDPIGFASGDANLYRYVGNSPLTFIDQVGLDWIKFNGTQVIWYAGDYGDTSKPLHTFKGTSGLILKDPITGEIINDYRNARFQNQKNAGPTMEGKYRINLKPDPNRIAKADPNTCELLRNPEGGIEKIPETCTSNDGETYIFPGWGTVRAYLEPQQEQPRGSFYLHDSAKGYTHGCTETEKALFGLLLAFRQTNDYIYVMVDYPTGTSSTYGGTDRP